MMLAQTVEVIGKERKKERKEKRREQQRVVGRYRDKGQRIGETSLPLLQGELWIPPRR